MVLGLALAGCSKKNDEGDQRVTTTPTPPPEATPPAAKEPPPSATPPAAPVAPAAGAARFIAMTCDQVFPQAVRDKLEVAVSRIEEGTDPAIESASCVFHAKAEPIVVRAQCYEGATPEAFAAVARDALAPAALGAPAELEGVGRGASVWTLADDVGVAAIDDNADCVLTATIPKRLDPAAFVKDVLATWPPK